MNRQEYDQFEPPPGHLSITLVDPATNEGMTSVLQNRYAQGMYEATCENAAGYTPNEKERRANNVRDILMSDECRSRDSQAAKNLHALWITYMVMHPDKRTHEACQDIMHQLSNGDGCHVRITVGDDGLAMAMRVVENQSAH